MCSRSVLNVQWAKLEGFIGARRALLESIGKGHDSVGNVLQLSFELGTFGSEFLPTCAHSMPILWRAQKDINKSQVNLFDFAI